MENGEAGNVVSGRMKNPIFFAFLASAAIFLSPTGNAAEDHTKLGEQMEKMNDAYKAIRKETDPVKGAELAREAQKEVAAGILEVPEMVKVMKDPAEKAKAEVAYRKMMVKLLGTFVDVEEAFVNGKLEDIEKLVENLKGQKKEGHDKFIPEE